MYRRLLLTLCLMLVVAPVAARAERTTQTATYVGFGMFARCGDAVPVTGTGCFEIGRSGISSMYVLIDDVNGLDQGGWIELFDAEDNSVASASFCNSTVFQVPSHEFIARAEVTAEFFHQEPCGPTPPPGPRPFSTAGEITIEY